LTLSSSVPWMRARYRAIVFQLVLSFRFVVGADRRWRCFSSMRRRKGGTMPPMAMAMVMVNAKSQKCVVISRGKDLVGPSGRRSKDMAGSSGGFGAP